MEILYFEGAEGIRRAHDDILLHTKFSTGEKKNLLSFSSGTDIVRLFPNIQKAFINKRIKNGSWYKAISTAESAKVREWTNDPKSLRTVKYVSAQDLHLSMTIDIYADNVMISSPTQPIGGVIIRNAKIANSMRSLFGMVWRLLPEITG